MRLVLVHGWGFDSAVWDDLAPLLPGHDIARVDLGFIAGDRSDNAALDDAAVAIGHSLGVMWLLKTIKTAPRALVSINGFARFSPPVPRASLVAMQQGIESKPLAQLKHFWRTCGVAPYATAEAIDQLRLAQGLGWLMDWDATEALQRLPCPRLVLASRDDKVVPADMSVAQWGGDAIDWSDDGGHVLPLSRAAWCAERIGAFLDRF
jgi:pimeloyl-[acyl-carrier protein] methyl ester esterase